MKKGILLATVLCAPVLYGCSPAQQLTITGSSGDVVLTLEEESLPEGVDPSSVKITRKQTSDSVEYQLEPDGLVLKKPGTLTITLHEARIPMPLVHASKAGEELEIVDTSVFVDLTKNQTTITVPVTHFSSVHHGIGSISYKTTMDIVPEKQAIGGDVTVTVSLERPDQEKFISYGDLTTRPPSKVFVNLLDKKPFVSGETGHQGNTHLRPPLFRDSPERTFMQATTLRFTRIFTCMQGGEAYVHQQFDLEYRGYLTRQNYGYADGEFTEPTGEEPRRYPTRAFKIDLDIGQSVECVVGSSSSSSSSSSSGTDAGFVDGNCLIIDRDHYPAEQFRTGEHAGGCDSAHWHADFPVVSLENNVREDPAPHNCGFGKVTEISVQACRIPKDLSDRLRRR